MKTKKCYRGSSKIISALFAFLLLRPPAQIPTKTPPAKASVKTPEMPKHSTQHAMDSTWNEVKTFAGDHLVLIDTAINFIPGIGLAELGMELLTHENPVTGVRMTNRELVFDAMVAAGGGAALGGALKVAGIAGKAIKNSALMAKLGVFKRGLEAEKQSTLRPRILENIANARTGTETSFFRIHLLAVETRKLDVMTDLDEAIFWSGRGNKILAEDFASHTGGLTLEMTSGGRYLDSLRLFDKYPGNQAIVPWARLSERFAQTASGKVSAFVEGSRPTSVFRRIEYPALLENPYVEEIIYSPKYTNIFSP